jgi:hypothetical protein
MRLTLLLVCGGLWAAAGCVHPHWDPPAPSGRTWQYDAQGALRETRSFGAGRTLGGGSYGYFFGGKGAEVPPGTDPDQFWKQQSVGSLKFNQHLAGQGERVTSGPRGVQVGNGRSAPAVPEED